MKRLTHFLPELLILFVAIALRFHNITALGLEHDEVANWLIDKGILAGKHGIYFTEAYGHEAGYHYLQTLSISLLGDNIFALRFPSVCLGILAVAVSYTVGRTFYNRPIARIAMLLVAITFFPIFYSRLGIRAILLPVLSGLSAIHFWRAWQQKSSRGWTWAGMFAGLTVYSYMASRTVPIFYGGMLVVLALTQWKQFRQQWKGITLFSTIYLLFALPMIYYLQTTPNVNVRVDEVNAPLIAMKNGDFSLVWNNFIQVIQSFGWVGDESWRQNVAGEPIFNPFTAVLFYGGILVALWKPRPRDLWILFWLFTALIPTIVTDGAPAYIRMIQVLPVMGLFPAIVMHNLIKLYTLYPQLSTIFRRFSWITCLTIVSIWGISRNNRLIFTVWPYSGDVPFVWQTSLTEMGRYLDSAAPLPTNIVGWSPEPIAWSSSSMDRPTVALAMQSETTQEIRHSNQTAIGFSAESIRLLHPNELPLHPALSFIHPVQTLVHTSFTEKILNRPEPLPIHAIFQEEIGLMDISDCVWEGDLCHFTTQWIIQDAPQSAERKIFVHVLDGDGNIVAQSDGLGFPTAEWQPNDLLVQAHTIGRVGSAEQLRIGLYHPPTGQQIPQTSGETFTLYPLPSSYP